MEEGKLLAVIVVEGNLVKNTILNIESDISEEELLKLNVLINSALNGLTIDQINLGIITAKGAGRRLQLRCRKCA